MERNVEIYFKVDGIEQYITNLEELDDVLKQVTNATDEATQSTKDFEKTAEEDFEKLEQRIQTTQGSVKVLAGSFEILAGAAGMLGLQDNEFFKGLEENVLNIIALSEGAINVAEGYELLAKNTKLATIAQRAFNLVSKANPYVLLASAVIGLAGAIGIYTLATNDETEATRQNYDLKEDLLRIERELARVREATIGRALDIADMETESRKAAMDNIQQNIDIIDEERQVLIASRSELLKRTNGVAFMNEEEKERFEQLNANIYQLGEEIEVEEELLEKINEIIEARKKEAEQTKNSANAHKENKDAIQEELDKLNEFFDTQSMLLEDDLREWRTYYDERLEMVRDFNQRYDDYIEQRMNEDERENANNERLTQLQMARDQMLMDSRYSLAQASVQAAGFVANMIERYGKDEEKAAKTAFIINKLASISDVILNYQKAKIGIWAGSAWLPPGAKESYRAKELLALRISSGISLATILATKFGGSGNQSIQTPSEASGGGGASISYSFGQQAGDVIEPGELSTGGSQQQPIQAYVLVSDVNNAQEANNQIQNLTRL